jgi:hypothetical protein
LTDVHLPAATANLFSLCGDRYPGLQIASSPLEVTCRRCLERVVCTSCKLRIDPCPEGPGHSVPAVGAGKCEGWTHHFNSQHNCGGSPMNVARPSLAVTR